MHPALSIILFTTASGAGYGMLVWLGLLTVAGALPPQWGFALAAILPALALVSVGLSASMAHLGRPERAWRAITQWRTSWLSREGIAALLTYGPALVFLLAWIVRGTPGPVAQAFGVIAAVMALVTIGCTAMIYRSLRPVRQWHNAYVLPNYLLVGLFSGAVCLSAVTGFWSPRQALLPGAIALACGAAALAGKLLYWRFIDRPDTTLTPGTATGLGHLGTVRQLDPPHVEQNYLLREMGFQVARRHAARLRRIALMVAFAVPIVLEIVVLAAPATRAAAALIAAVSVLLGLLVERWLFFAEATHTVTLYYGRQG